MSHEASLSYMFRHLRVNWHRLTSSFLSLKAADIRVINASFWVMK